MRETPAAVGTWVLNFMTPIGELSPDVLLRADGTGIAYSPFGEFDMSAVAYNGDSVTFSAVISTPMGEIEVTVSGIAVGDDFSGSLEGPMGPIPVTGVRKT